MPNVLVLPPVTDQVGAELGELTDDVLSGALAQSGQQHHGGHSHRHAERRQHRPQPVRRQRAEGETQQGEGVHAGLGACHAHLLARAATGSSRVARRAGMTPKAMPTRTDSASDAATAQAGVTAGNVG